jgi:glycosyltransferase involved in cell wall biosynthesis
MKIAYITGTLDLKTGAGRHAVNVINALTELGHEVSVVSSGHELFRQAGFGPFKFLALQHYIKEQAARVPVEAEILHAHDFYPYALIAAKARTKNQKLFINGIATDLVAKLEKPLIGRRLRQIAREATNIFCISGYTRGKIKEKIPELLNLETVNLGVDFEKFYQDLKSKAYFDASKRNPLIIGVGMIKRRKGFDTAIKAIAIVKKYYPGIKYLIVGKKDQTGFTWHLQELVKKLKLERNVEIIGEVSEAQLRELYQTSDIFLLPAQNIGEHFEGFGLVYLEAGAAGLPGIGSLDTGAEDAIDDGRTGYLVKQGNFKAIADKIIQLLKKPDQLKSMSARVQERAKSFSWEKTVKAYVTFYKL